MRRALIVTANRYSHYTQLRYCHADGHLLRRSLAELCGYDREGVISHLELDLTVSRSGTIRTKDAERFHELLLARTITPEDFTQVMSALVEVSAAISRRDFPFDGSMADWRPRECDGVSP